MDNERLAADAVALYTSVTTFVRRFRSELTATGCAPHVLPGLLEPIAHLADELFASADSAATQAAEVACREALPALSLSTLAHELAELRECITSMWEREIGGDHPAALRSLHTAIDRVIVLATQRDTTTAHLEGLLSASPVGIGFLDRDLRYLRINSALAAMHGRTVEEHVGHTVHEVLPAEAPLMEPLLRRILDTNSSVALDLEVPPDKDGTPRAFSGSYFPVHTPGGGSEVVGIGAVIVDVSDRKRMENELRRAVRTREDLIAIVSHDLRNPLGTITLGASLMDTDESLSPRSRKHLEMIVRSAVRMERLIDDLLDTASIHTGRLTLKLERVPAEAVLAEAIDSHAAMAATKEIALERTAALDGLELLCDPERVQRVFGNLIGNALKFCASGATIRVVGQPAGDMVQFDVEDTGPGIDPRALPNLFDPYWSAPEHARRGVGLGLFISSGIVTAHGGRIWVDSTPGQGTCFHFTLPLAR